MKKTTLTLHSVLKKIKTTKARLEKVLGSRSYDIGDLGEMIAYIDKSKYALKDEIAKTCQSNYDTAWALIYNLEALEEAKLLANSTTQVEVRGKTKTIAQWLQRLSTISLEEKMLVEMQKQYASATKEYSENVGELDEYIQDRIKDEKQAAKEIGKSFTQEDIEALEKSIRNGNIHDIVDPVHLNEKIIMLKREIEGLREDIDAALQVANAITQVEVELAD